VTPPSSSRPTDRRLEVEFSPDGVPEIEVILAGRRAALVHSRS
jgi:hypothetical protein